MNITILDQNAVLQAALADLKSGEVKYDGYALGASITTDAVEGSSSNTSGVASLDDFVNASSLVEWDSITPFLRQRSATYNGEIKNVPLNGAFYYLVIMSCNMRMMKSIIELISWRYLSTNNT